LIRNIQAGLVKTPSAVAALVSCKAMADLKIFIIPSIEISGGTCRLHLQGGRLGQAREQYESAACHLLSRWFLLGLFFYSEDGGEIFLRNIG
jgi:hypothetical protein